MTLRTILSSKRISSTFDKVAKCFFVVLMMVLVLAGCGGTKSAPVTLTSITVTPSGTSITPGTTAQFRAAGFYSDGSVLDVTATVAWSSSIIGIATISNTEGSKGVATAVAVGSTTITAASGNVFGSTALTSAALESIAVTPAGSTSIVGTKKQFRATGVLSNSVTQDLTKLVDWSSSNTLIATISADGISTADAAGESTISATFSGISGSTTLTAATVTSIAVTPANPTIAVGTTQQFAATGTLSNNTTQSLATLVTWSSSNAGVATINASGIASSLSSGSTTVTAAIAGVSGTTTMTVQGPVSISVTPANPSVVVGSSQKFTAVGTFADGSVQDLTTLVSWSSSNSVVATISDTSGSKGLASALATGSTSITATLGVSGTATMTVKSLVSISVSPVSPIIGVGSTLQFAAAGAFSDISTQDITTSVTWRSENPGVATISDTSGSKGLVTAKALGVTNITATFGGISISTSLTVNQSNRAYVANNGSNTLSVIDTASNKSIATVAVGIGPQGVAVNAAANRAYVTNSGSNSLSVIDTGSNSLVATIGMGVGPGGIAVNPSTNRAYVANSNSGTLSVIDTVNNTVIATIAVGTGPQDVALNQAAGRAYVANGSSNNISVIDTTSSSVVATIGAGLGPQGVAVDPSSNRVYVANSGSNTLSVINTTSNAVIATIAVGIRPQGVAANPGANRVYVANSSSNTISVIDTTINTVVSTIAVGTAPQGVAVNSAANRVYVTNSGSNTLSVIDTVSNTSPIGIAVGIGPREVAVIP